MKRQKIFSIFAVVVLALALAVPAFTASDQAAVGPPIEAMVSASTVPAPAVVTAAPPAAPVDLGALLHALLGGQWVLVLTIGGGWLIDNIIEYWLGKTKSTVANSKIEFFGRLVKGAFTGALASLRPAPGGVVATAATFRGPESGGAGAGSGVAAGVGGDGP